MTAAPPALFAPSWRENLIDFHTDFANTTITAHRVTLEYVEGERLPAEAADACCAR